MTWTGPRAPPPPRRGLARDSPFRPPTFHSPAPPTARPPTLSTPRGGGAGQWALEIEGGRCRSYEGAPQRATLEFRTTPAHWLDFVTRELKPLPALLTR